MKNAKIIIIVFLDLKAIKTEVSLFECSNAKENSATSNIDDRPQ